MQMSLAFGFGDLSQVVIGENSRLCENRLGDLDVFVTRQSADNAWRCALRRRQFIAQFDQRLTFDLLDQPCHQFVEEVYGFVGVGLSSQKQVGQFAEHRKPLRTGALGQAGLEFGEQRIGLFHRDDLPPGRWYRCSEQRYQ
ncbi:MAG TPA: hypothetical protein VGH13_16665 [Xanthobacteraceae bacterium]